MPPHWAALVISSAVILLYTEKQVGTWQSISDIQMDDRDFSGKIFYPTTSNQVSEGVVEKHHITFEDEDAQNVTNSITQQLIVETTPNTWQMPVPINLDSSGLRHSSKTLVLARHD